MKYKIGQEVEYRQFDYTYKVEVRFSEFDTFLECEKYVVKRKDGYMFLTVEDTLHQCGGNDGNLKRVLE